MKLVRTFSKAQPLAIGAPEEVYALWVCEVGHPLVLVADRDALDLAPEQCDVCELLGRFETKVTQELSTEPVGPAVEQVAGEVLASLPGPDDILDQGLGRSDTVHELHHGIATCGLRGSPRNWPAGHRWASRERFRNDYEWSDNPGDRRCPRCLASSVTDGMAQAQALNAVGTAERLYVVERESGEVNFDWSPAGQFTDLGPAKGAEANWHEKGYATRILQVDEISRQKGKKL